MGNCIICKNVSKIFKGRKKQICALKKINLKINKGEFVVLCGENGSGKSTLLKIMMGLLIPDQGSVQVLDINVIKHWKKLSPKIGVMLSNERSLYWKLTARENLDVFGNIYGVKSNKLNSRITELLKEVNLLEFENQLVETYSTGMNRKLMLCKALIHNPEILFADEILNGLDSKASLEVINMLSKLNKKGMTIVMVSHILHNLPNDCKIILMKNGLIVSEEKLSTLNVKKVIKIKAIVNNKEIEKVVTQDNLSKNIVKLTELGALNIRIQNDSIYDVTRRALS